MRLAPASKAKGVKPKTKRVKSMKTPAAKVNASQSTLIGIVTPAYQPNCMRCDGLGCGVTLDAQGRVCGRELVCKACGAIAPMADKPCPGAERREARVVHRALLSAHGPVVTPHEAAIQRAISGLKSKNRIANT